MFQGDLNMTQPWGESQDGVIQSDDTVSKLTNLVTVDNRYEEKPIHYVSIHITEIETLYLDTIFIFNHLSTFAFFNSSKFLPDPNFTTVLVNPYSFCHVEQTPSYSLVFYLETRIIWSLNLFCNGELMMKMPWCFLFEKMSYSRNLC